MKSVWVSWNFLGFPHISFNFHRNCFEKVRNTQTYHKIIKSVRVSWNFLGFPHISFNFLIYSFEGNMSKIMANRTWKGLTSSCWPCKPNLAIWLARPAENCTVLPCPSCQDFKNKLLPRFEKVEDQYLGLPQSKKEETMKTSDALKNFKFDFKKQE